MPVIYCHRCRERCVVTLEFEDEHAFYFAECTDCGATQSFPTVIDAYGQYRIEPGAYRRYCSEMY